MRRNYHRALLALFWTIYLTLVGSVVLGAIAVSRCASAGPVSPEQPLAGEVQVVLGTEPVPPAEIRAAFVDATRLLVDTLGLPDPGWKMPAAFPVLRSREAVVPGPGPERLLGAYYVQHSLGKGGKPIFHEKLVLYLLPDEDCYAHDVLVHELLHWYHYRLRYLGQLRDVDPEVFVRTLTGEGGPRCR